MAELFITNNEVAKMMYDALGGVVICGLVAMIYIAVLSSLPGSLN